MMEERSHHFLRRLGTGKVVNHEQIDVRLGELFPAAVAGGRHDTEFVVAQKGLRQAGDQFVDQVGMAFEKPVDVASGQDLRFEPSASLLVPLSVCAYIGDHRGSMLDESRHPHQPRSMGRPIGWVGWAPNLTSNPLSAYPE